MKLGGFNKVFALTAKIGVVLVFVKAAIAAYETFLNELPDKYKNEQTNK